MHAVIAEAIFLPDHTRSTVSPKNINGRAAAIHILWFHELCLDMTVRIGRYALHFAVAQQLHADLNCFSLAEQHHNQFVELQMTSFRLSIEPRMPTFAVIVGPDCSAVYSTDHVSADQTE